MAAETFCPSLGRRLGALCRTLYRGLPFAAFRLGCISHPVGTGFIRIRRRNIGGCHSPVRRFRGFRSFRSPITAIRLRNTALIRIGASRVVTAGTGQVVGVIDHDAGYAVLAGVMMDQREKTASCQGQIDGDVERYGNAGSDAAPSFFPGLHGWPPLSAARPMWAIPARLKASRTSAT